MHNNSYKLNFLHVAYKKAEMPCKYKGVNYLNVNFSSARDNLRNLDLRSNPCFIRVCGVVRCGEKRWNLLSSQRICNTFATKISKNIGHFSVIGTGECPFCYADFVSAVTLSSSSKVLLIASTRTCISK